MSDQALLGQIKLVETAPSHVEACSSAVQEWRLTLQQQPWWGLWQQPLLLPELYLRHGKLQVPSGPQAQMLCQTHCSMQ